MQAHKEICLFEHRIVECGKEVTDFGWHIREPGIAITNSYTALAYHLSVLHQLLFPTCCPPMRSVADEPESSIKFIEGHDHSPSYSV
jgi:hypothetical protein